MNLEIRQSRMGHGMQNFSHSKSCSPYEWAQVFSILFPLFLYTANSAILCQGTRIFKNACCSQTHSWSFILLALYRGPLLPFLDGFLVLILDYWLYLSFSPSLFFPFGLSVQLLDIGCPGSRISWTTLCCNKWFRFVCFAQPEAIPLCVLCTQGVPLARPALKWAQGQIPQWFQTHHKSFPALCGQLFDNVSDHDPHPWADFSMLAIVYRENAINVCHI